MTILIFVSHSSQDAQLAGLFAALLRSAFRLSAEEIRCTSVDGYRLPVGAETNDQLRREIMEAPVMIGILSANSMASAYVLFELGARWGQRSFLAPILGPGMKASQLAGPIMSLNALCADNPSHIHQLIRDISSQLRIQPEGPHAYQALMDALLMCCRGEENFTDTVESTSKPEEDATDHLRVQVLQAIARLAEKPWGRPSVEDIANEIHGRPHEVEYVLELLEQGKFVSSNEGPMAIRTYALEQNGRGLLIGIEGSSARGANLRSQRR